MTLAKPPSSGPPGTPRIATLPAGTVLVRVHGVHPADAFNPTAQPSRLTGGRIDSLDGTFAYTYLGAARAGAVAETLCRDLPLSGAARTVPHAGLVGKRLTEVEVVRDLPVLVLHGAALAHVGATLDLTKCDAGSPYLITREWARVLRGWLPDVAGFRYRCRHDEDEIAYVLFDDGPTAAARSRAAGSLRARPDTSIPLDSPRGVAIVMEVLRAHDATLEELG